MNRRDFLARVPAVAALPFLGRLTALAGTAEPEMQQGTAATLQTLETEIPVASTIYDEGRVAVIDGEFHQFYGSMQSGEWLILRRGLQSILVRDADRVVRLWDLASGAPVYP